ncbi:hypothetical protein [Sphingomicrobium clamense]|uniref:Lipoprotein n=1 Tax=Sphingomicrobium clamense TaxID=2851013 RepID=A0ABS6V6G5_9SPHN|nr:hypothetical protein [Sphingomicrobium sp. B8]MBW0144950.1 hypothetical protein [Sphingomicrobium sp. B8]
MRYLIVPMALCLVACEAEPEATVEPGASMEAEVEAEAEATTFDGGPVVGTYTATSDDGTVLTQTTTGDGKVTSVDGDGNSVEGTYSMTDEGFCITNEGAEEACYAYSDLREDGSWTATNVTDPEDRWIVSRSSE